jgi:hypothetical protein
MSTPTTPDGAGARESLPHKRRVTMKSITAVAFAICLLASFAVVGTVSAQDHTMKANIPFDFSVGNTWMPAGEYTISSPLREIVEVRSADLTRTAEIVSSPSHNESRSGSKLVFDKYGDQYFLRHVLCSSVASLNLDVPQGKVEKEARARSLEARGHNGEQTMVAAK